MNDVRVCPEALRLVTLAVALLLAGGCDMPSTGPSFETETGLRTPVVVDKTFVLLGGDQSPHEPLIDTTTSAFDSLFTVAESDQSLSIEQEVSSFDIGSLDQAFGEATEGIAVDTSIAEPVVQESGLASQTVRMDPIREENGRPPPTDPASASTPVANTTRPFPARLLDVPDFNGADIQADSLRRGTLTGETTYEGTPVNRLTVTLTNDPRDPTPLTDGNEGGPVVRLEDETGSVIAAADFAAPIQAGADRSITLSVAGQTFGRNSALALQVVGSDQDPRDELTLALSPLRYQKATLSGVTQARVAATRSNLSIRETGETQFAGLEAQSGTLRLDVTNNLRFPIEVDSLQVTNAPSATSALPDSFPTLDILEAPGAIPAGQTRTLEVDVSGRGLAEGIDVQVRGHRADGHDVLTTAASDNIALSAQGPISVQGLYFWPDGEQVRARGTVAIRGDRVRFERADDFVELNEGTLALSNIVSETDVSFESLTLSFPDIRRSPYAPEDSLVISVGGDLAAETVGLGDVRLMPFRNGVENVLAYRVRGTLGTVPPAEQTEQTLRVLRLGDRVHANVSVGNLDVRALRAGADPFTVNVTPDANGDERLDLARPTESRQSSFGSFGGIVSSIEGLELSGSRLKFRIRTDVGTDAQLYAALQGRGGTTRSFLAGQGSEKAVASTSPMSGNFVNDGTPIATDNLIQFGVDGAPTDAPVTRSIVLDGDNSTVDGFLSTLPTALRLVAQARLAGTEDGRLRLRRPLTFDAGLRASVPVRVAGPFVVVDTIDADFSGLEDLTDPGNDVTVSGATLNVEYDSGIPLGAEVQFTVLGAQGQDVITLPEEGDPIRLNPAPKAEDGTARGTRTGTAHLDLDTQALRALARGRQLRLRLNMDLAESGGPSTLRASDAIDLALTTEVDASVGGSN